MGAVILAGKGEYRDWRAIAAIHQRTLTSVITLDGYGITSPKDLEGKEVGASTGSANQLLFPAYARLAGIDASKVKFQNGKTTDLNGWLVTGKVRALTTFLLGQVAIEKAAGGKKAIVFPFGQYTTPLSGEAFGAIDEQRLAKAIATLQDAGLMPAGRKPADVAALALTPKA